MLFELFSCSKLKQASPPRREVFVKFQKAELMQLFEEFETVGELKADKEILVSAERAGQVQKVYITEGRWVAQGASLVQIKGDDVKSDLQLAQADYERMKVLYEKGAISSQNLMQYENKLNITEAQADNLLITAITDGFIGEIYVDPGDYVRQGDRIMDLVKIYPLRVSYSVPERLLPYLKPSQLVDFSTDLDPDIYYQARVDFISPRVDPETRTILIRAQLISQVPSLKANQFVRVRQRINYSKESIVVKEESIFIEQGQEYVYIADVKSDGSGYLARRAPIKTGLRQGSIVQIIDGVDEGENVVYAGLQSIYPGADLQEARSVNN